MKFWRRIRTRRDKTLVAAVVAAAGLRLAWIVVATRTPTDKFNDSSQYLRTARGILAGQTPTFNTGHHSAFFSPGYPVAISPLIWLGRSVHMSPAFAAALTNAIAGVLSVVMVAFLAARWIGPRARNPAAWIQAIGPGQIYFTSNSQTETVATTFYLLTLCAGTIAVDRWKEGDRRLAPLIGVGILVGATTLIRSNGLVLLVVPALTIRARSGSWKGIIRATTLTVAGAAVLLVPWTIRNGVQVGIWTPLSTREVTALCVGHSSSTGERGFSNNLGQGGFEVTPHVAETCYRNSPYDDPAFAKHAPQGSDFHFSHPDEAKWVNRATNAALTYIVHHPAHEFALAVHKTWGAWNSEWDSVDAARSWQQYRWAGVMYGPLEILANVWLWAVYALSLLALVKMPAVRKALPLLAVIFFQALGVMASEAVPHFRFTAIPMLAIFAGGAVGALVDKGQRQLRAMRRTPRHPVFRGPRTREREVDVEPVPHGKHHQPWYRTPWPAVPR